MLKNLLKFILIPVSMFANFALAQSNDQLESQCDQQYERIVSKATEAQKGAAAKGDFAEITRLNLVRSIEIRNLYSSQCVGAKRATSRRELGQRGIDMNKNFCQQWGMGDQCAAPPVLARSPSTVNDTGSRSSNDTGSRDSSRARTHDAAAEAHECVALDNAGSGNFGAFKNICSYKVNFYTCNYKPRTIQGGFNWSADVDCEKNQFGLHTPDAGRSVAAHNRNTEMVYWYACKAPATPADAVFVVGKGIEARCY